MPDTHEMIRQHHELIALCRKLDEAVKRRRPRPEIYQIMDELIACTATHFEAEERLMAEAGYPELEGHKARHKELLERTRKFRRRLELYGEENFTEWFNHWPFPFILAHIQNGDHQIGDHIRATYQSSAPAAASNADRTDIPAIMRRAVSGSTEPAIVDIKVPRELVALHTEDAAAKARAAVEKARGAAYLQKQED
jgi:hemerythrin